MFLCQMSGIPGTGKSTLARRICRITNAFLLDLDVIKSSVMNTFEDEINFQFASRIAYQLAFSLADSNLEMGNSVVIDSPCRYEEIIEQGTALAKKHNVPYKFIECYLEAGHLHELNRRRVMREILPSQRVNIPIYQEKFEEVVRSLKRPANHEYLLVDTSEEIEKYIVRAIEYLRR